MLEEVFGHGTKAKWRMAIATHKLPNSERRAPFVYSMLLNKMRRKLQFLPVERAGERERTGEVRVACITGCSSEVHSILWRCSLPGDWQGAVQTALQLVDTHCVDCVD